MPLDRFDDTEDVSILARNWGSVVLRGAVAVLFGLLCLFAPRISLAALVFLFGGYAFADGILSLVSVMRRRSTPEPWWVVVLQGLAGIGAGIVTFLWPGLTALALLYVVAVWALVSGVFTVAAAIRLRKVIRGEWMLALAGIASIVLGIALISRPGPGALALVIWLGVYELTMGVLLLGLGFRLRSLEHRHAFSGEHAPVSV